MRPWSAVLATALVVLVGCTSGGAADHPPGEPEAEPGTAAPTATGAPSDRVQQALDDARPTEEQLGMAVDESYRREAGLRTATFAYCGDQGDPVDRLRIARTQRWWKDHNWPQPDQGGYTVGVEIVYYEPGGVAQTMDAFRAVPEQCPVAEYATGTKASFAPAEPPDGLPEAALAIKDEWTYPDGATAPGLIVAIPAGDVLGFLYIRGHAPTVHERAGELAQLLADNVARADALIKSWH
jgi:hypothetical protein